MASFPQVCQPSSQRMAVSVQGVVLLVVTPCSLVGRHRHVLHLLNVVITGCLLREALNIRVICVVYAGNVSVPSQNFCCPYEMAALMQVFDAQPRRM